MRPICGLEEKHRVNLGTRYKNYKGCAMFVKFIAQERREVLLDAVSKTNFSVFKQMRPPIKETYRGNVSCGIL